MALRTKEKSTQVYFVRHGKTNFPENRIYCDDVEDPPLSDEGLRQVALMARHFEGVAVRRILASPAARTWMTAAAIAQRADVEPERAPWLMERRFGTWEGMDFDAIERQYHDDYLAWKAAPVAFTPPGGENTTALLDRLQRGLEDPIRRHRGEILVVVTHVGPIRSLLAHAFDIPLEQSRQLRVDPASITRIDYGEKRNNLIFLNQVSYKKL